MIHGVCTPISNRRKCVRVRRGIVRLDFGFGFKMTSSLTRATAREFGGDDADDGFDRVGWINARTSQAAAASSGTTNNVSGMDGFLTDLELQLQLLGEDLSTTLEERSREGVQRAPRAMRELELVEDRVEGLREEVRKILERLDETESSSRASVETLRALDAAKRRMDSARETLQEANGLADLMASVDGVFASGNIRAMSDALARMKRGLAVVGDVPEFADGQDKVNAFEHKLEGIVRPALVTALESQNSTAARELGDVLRATGRGSALESTYADTRVTTRMLKQWKSRQRASTSTETVAEAAEKSRLVSDFLSYLAGELRKEIAWCSSTFPDDAGLLIPVSWCSMHAALEASLTEVLSAMSLEELVPVRRAFEAYVSDVGGALSKIAVESLSTSRADAVKGAVGDAMMAIVEPFIAVEQRYGELELTHLRSELEALVQVPQAQSIATSDDLTAVVQTLLETLPKAMGALSAAVDRCDEITGGVEVLTCVHAIESGIEHYVDLVSLVLRDLRKAAGLIDSTAATLKVRATSAGEEYIRGSLSLLELINAAPSAALDLEMRIRDKIVRLRTKTHPALDASTEYSDGTKARSLTELSAGAHASRTRKLIAFFEKVAEAAAKHSLDSPILPVGYEHINALTRAMEKFVYDTLLGRVSLELKGIANSDVWSAKPMESAYKLPTFSAYPQECMTNAGEYLLSLPQYLDNLHDDDAVRIIAPVAGESFDDSATAEVWIGKVAEASAELVLKEVQAIKALSEQGSAQLAADLEYFSNIVAALSLSPPEMLIAWCKCVSTPVDEYIAFAHSPDGVDPRVVRAVAAARDIVLTH